MTVVALAAGDGRVGRLRWLMLALLFGATSISYMDRFLLGVLKPTVIRDLNWSETDYANVIVSFQLAYAVGLLTVGRVIDRIGARAGLALVVGLCAVAAASHSAVASVTGFIVARFALGFGEAGVWPGCAKVVSEWFPRKERALGMGVVNAGSSVGATITPLVVPLLLTVMAWPFTFLFTASLDLVWLAVWLVSYRAPARHPRLSSGELAYIGSDLAPPSGKVGWLALFRHRQTWAFLLAKGLSDPVWWFYLFWVPGFLAQRYIPAGASAAAIAAAMAGPLVVIYLLADAGSVAGGWLSMRLIDRGWTINAARKTVMLGCALLVVPVCLVSQPIGLWPSVLLIGVAAAAHLGFSANLFTVATDTVPSRAISSVAGIGGMAAALGGMGVAKLVGYVLDATHSYAIPFALASGAYLLALAILHLLLPRLEPMTLDARTDPGR